MCPNKSLGIPVTKGINGIYFSGDGVYERIVIGYPGTVRPVVRVSVIFCIESKNLSLIHVIILRIIRSQAVIELTGTLVSNSIVKMIFPITLRNGAYFQSAG